MSDKIFTKDFLMNFKEIENNTIEALINSGFTNQGSLLQLDLDKDLPYIPGILLAQKFILRKILDRYQSLTKSSFKNNKFEKKLDQIIDIFQVKTEENDKILHNSNTICETETIGPQIKTIPEIIIIDDESDDENGFTPEVVEQPVLEENIHLSDNNEENINSSQSLCEDSKGIIDKLPEVNQLIFIENSEVTENNNNMTMDQSDDIETNNQTTETNVGQTSYKVKKVKQNVDFSEEIMSIQSNNQTEESDFIQINTFKCKYCSLEFNKMNEMSLHLKTHINDKPHKCTECADTFNKKINLRIHVCGQHFKAGDGLPQTYTCCECNENFDRLAKLKSHLKDHQIEDELYCCYCNQQFSTDFYLKKHINSEHIIQPNNHIICLYCKKMLKSNISVRIHHKIHLDPKLNIKRKKRYSVNECTTCGKAFKRREQLVRHKRTHTGEKPFVCDICSTGFSQRCNLERHHRRQHSRDGEYQCQLCRVSFEKRHALSLHFTNFHPNEEKPSNA